MRDACLADDERAARVDVLHQVVALHLQGLGAGQVDRARVVHAHVDPTEALHRLLDGREHLFLVADVAHDRQCAPAGLLDLLGGGEDGALEARVGLGGLRDQGHVRAVARGPEGDRETDPAAPAGDEQRPALERSGHRIF